MRRRVPVHHDLCFKQELFRAHIQCTPCALCRHGVTGLHSMYMYIALVSASKILDIDLPFLVIALASNYRHWRLVAIA